MSYFSFKPICKISLWKFVKYLFGRLQGFIIQYYYENLAKLALSFSKTSQKEVFAINGGQKSLKSLLKDIFPKFMVRAQKNALKDDCNEFQNRNPTYRP